LDDLWIHGYVSEKAMFPMLEEQMPDVVVHFAQSELNGAVNKGMVKRAGINTVRFAVRTQTSRSAPHPLWAHLLAPCRHRSTSPSSTGT